MEESKYGKKWSEEETILAFYYYCRIPFGKIHKTNTTIIQLASLLGRTPSSVVFKMGNLGHFDPELQKRNVSGLSNASKTDEVVVQQFYENWEELTLQADIIQAEMEKSSGIVIAESQIFPEGTTRTQSIKARNNQQFFRDAVLSSYQGHCCITGIAIPALLIASHIKPWAVSDPKTERTNPSNGLCLNALHDRAFDQGLITVLPDFTVLVSTKMKMASDSDSSEWLMRCNRQKIRLPEKFTPSREFLEYHNDTVFIP